MTAALEGGEWSAARPGRTLPPGKTGYPFCRRLGGPQGRSGRAENLVPTGIRSRTVQPIVVRYTDWATRPHVCMYVYNGCNVGANRELHGFRVEPVCVLLTPIGKHFCFISGSEVSETGRNPKPLETSKTIRKKSKWFWYVSIWLCRWCRFT